MQGQLAAFLSGLCKGRTMPKGHGRENGLLHSGWEAVCVCKRERRQGGGLPPLSLPPAFSLSDKASLQIYVDEMALNSGLPVSVSHVLGLQLPPHPALPFFNLKIAYCFYSFNNYPESFMYILDISMSNSNLHSMFI